MPQLFIIQLAFASTFNNSLFLLQKKTLFNYNFVSKKLILFLLKKLSFCFYHKNYHFVFITKTIILFLLQKLSFCFYHKNYHFVFITKTIILILLQKLSFCFYHKNYHFLSQKFFFAINHFFSSVRRMDLFPNSLFNHHKSTSHLCIFLQFTKTFNIINNLSY